MLPVMRSTVPKYFSQVPLTRNRQQPLAFTDDPDYLNGGIDKIANDAFSDRLGGKFPNGAPYFLSLASSSRSNFSITPRRSRSVVILSIAR